MPRKQVNKESELTLPAVEGLTAAASRFQTIKSERGRLQQFLIGSDCVLAYYGAFKRGGGPVC